MSAQRKEEIYKRLKYVISYPDGFKKANKYPLVIFLHGAGSRGDDIELILSHPFFAETEKFNLNVISVAPQCYKNSWFDIFEQLQDFAEFSSKLDFVDCNRIYLIGASMGGYAVWQLAISKPNLFAAIVPICGGGMYWDTDRIKNIGIWAFHGSDDLTVFCDESKKMVEAVNKRGGSAKLTIYDGVPHNSWIPTFNNIEMWGWLLKQTRTDTESFESFQGVKKFG